MEPIHNSALLTEGLLIEVRGLDVIYGSAAQAIWGVNLEVSAGSIVTLLGPNGSGKTTLIRAITGLLGYQSGRITSGEINLFQRPTKNLSPQAIVRMGLAHVPEGRGILAELTVEDNLRLGGIANKDQRQLKKSLERTYEMFPVLGDRNKTSAGYLSGGEQQMLAIGRALMNNPQLIVLDEPSLGLAPVIVQKIQEHIVEINQSGTTILLVEQNVSMALDIAHRGYVLERGRVAKEGSTESLRGDIDVQKLYLGGDR